MTPEQETRGAELFAEGKSERQVATELDVGVGSAHRLRVRLTAKEKAAAEESAPEPADGPEVFLMTALPEPDYEAELAALAEIRDGQAVQLQNFVERADASRQAIAGLEAERLQLLDADRDAAPLRPRIASAAEDLNDSETAAARCRERLDATVTRISEITAARDERRRLAAEQAAREEAGELGGQLAPQAATALRAAVTGDGPVRQLTDLASQLAGAEQVCGQSWDEVVLPPAPPGMPDEWRHSAVSRLWAAARRGDVAACQELVPACAPWQDRDPAEIERMRAEALRRVVEMQELWRRNMMRGFPQQGQQWTREDVSSVDVDQYGREIHRPAYQPHPLDSYRAPGIFGAGSYGPGYRTQ